MSIEVQAGVLPDDALLQRYRKAGAYTDCYYLDVPAAISHEQYVKAFYTTRVFKIERVILKLAVNKPSTDEDVARLAAGQAEAFAAWTVEVRAPDQILLRDFQGKTCSWLMTAPQGNGTRLYFGSAVTAMEKSGDGTPRMAFIFRSLLGFHQLYSRILLHAAARRLGG